MPFVSDILEYIACPQCRGSLRYTREELLVCLPCRLCFPVENGVPNLHPESALPLGVQGQVLSAIQRVVIIVEQANNSGSPIYLEMGTCRAFGRSMEDASVTRAVNIDGTIPLVDKDKKLVGNYLKRNSTHRFKKNTGPLTDSVLGGFKRLSDVVFADLSMSRLHAMIFYDESGVGLLDLVSRNGTFVNEKEIEASFLKDGDSIVMGQTKMRLSLGKL